MLSANRQLKSRPRLTVMSANMELSSFSMMLRYASVSGICLALGDLSMPDASSMMCCSSGDGRILDESL